MEIPREVEDKMYAAETHVAAVRLAVIVLNILVFLFLIPPEQTIPWLAYAVSAVALTYALVVVAFHPEFHFPALGTSLFTSVSDATLITLWILGTGGFGSPFYVLWYVSIAAIALRFDARTTVLVSLGYVAVYLGLIGALGAIRPENAAEIVVRNAYTVFIGVLGGWLAYETLTQSRARTAVVQMAEGLDLEVQRQTRELLDREEDLKRSLDDLEKANSRLQELDRLKTTFINTTAHELRTPLTSLKLQLHMLRTAKLGTLNQRQRRATELLDRNMERLAMLINDVGDAAKLQGGHFKIDPEPVELRAVLDEVLDTMQEPARVHDITITLSAPDELWVRGDANRLTQVLFNLMSNAMKFNHPGGAVEVVAEERGPEARISVRNTGPGLDTSQMDRLFRAFSQVHDPMETTEPGTGLGLYISKGIVEHHGGRIWCESEGRARGATFLFTVPLHQGVPHHGEEDARVAKGPESRPGVGSAHADP